MKGYVVYHYAELKDWEKDLYDKGIPVFDFVTNDRAKAIEYSESVGGMYSGYYVAQVGQLEFV